MRVLLINAAGDAGGAGGVCIEIAQKYADEGHEVVLTYGRYDKLDPKAVPFARRIGTPLDVRLHAVKSMLLDAHGLGSRHATKRFLAWAETWKPDLVWLHNLHGYYVNYELLFAWIKRHPELEVRWTLHDCWAFTGHCAYFTMAGCEKWKTSCSACPQKGSYPASLMLDRSKENYARKQKAFTGVKNMTLITPSRWLARLVKESFLKDYPVQVVYNTIDTTVFQPTPGDFRQRYSLEDKKIVLGVSFAWQEPRKGLKDLIELRALLPGDYAIVLVGLTDELQKTLPPGILGLGKTGSREELAEIYTAADVFVNPTHEDNYPTVNLEAQACGTPVITYNTGGSPESVPPENVVPCGDVQALAGRIRELLEHA